MLACPTNNYNFLKRIFNYSTSIDINFKKNLKLIL